METIMLDLRPEYGRTFIKRLGVVIIVFVIAGIVLMLASVMPVNYYLLISMFFLIVQGIGNWYWLKPVKMLFDEKGITGSISPRKAISLTWDQISKIEVHTFAMDIQARDGRTEHIDLSGINYEQQKSIKPRIIELAKSKGINVVAD